VELYIKTASKAVDSVTVVYVKLAVGVVNAVVPVAAGAFQLVTVTPPAV
jgi:hypothetical protein